MPMVISGVIATLHNDLLLVMYIELCRTQTSEHTIKSGTIQKHASVWPNEFCITTFSPTVWVDRRSHQGDITVINQLITVISPSPETFRITDLTPNYNYIIK